MKGETSIYLSALIAFLMLILIFPLPSTFSWSYGNPAKTSDTKYENYGPRADKLLINLYSDDATEWHALETGQIDVTDCPLDDAHYNSYTTPPWNNTIDVLGYGPEFGLYLFDLNNNNNLYLGNPQNPAYPNPVYPNPMSDVDLRKAVAYLSDRQAYINYIGPTTVTALYTPVGPSAGKYASPTIYPGGDDEALCYLYNPAAANATLDAGGFPVGPGGWRYWDMNGNHVKDASEDLVLKIVGRSDSSARAFAASDISTSLRAAGVFTSLSLAPSGFARLQVMGNKNYHIYTGYKAVSPEPDYLVDWNWDYYWHPGRPYNYAGCNSAAFNAAADGVQYANDQAEAVTNAHEAEYAYCHECLSVPLWTSTGFKAASRTYVGGTAGEAAAGYVGNYWEDFVNIPGYGVDNGFSFMDMHPEGYAYGNGNMTIRYGFKQPEIDSFNPIYADSSWDNKVIDLIGYDSLLSRNPYNLGQFMPMVALKYTVSTYLHPDWGTCSKVVFTLRPGVEWSDGTPLTMADVYFTLVEIDGLLESRGLPPPSWIRNVMDILSFEVLDPYSFEVLFDVKSIFAVNWLSAVPILPEHVWMPIITAGDPTGFAPDPNMIGCGPFRLQEYVPGSHLLLVANAPDTTVTSPVAGATPVTSDMGFYRFSPITGYLTVPGTDYYKFNMSAALNAIDVHFVNEKSVAVTCDLTATITEPDGTSIVATLAGVSVNPGGFVWHNPWPIAPLQHYGLWKVAISATFSDRPSTWAATELLWVTIREDICGSTWYDDMGLGSYPYKNKLPSPDIAVDTQDVKRAEHAWGTSPGDARWDLVADIVKDYKIDVPDSAAICKKYGWLGSPIDIAVISVYNAKTGCSPLPTVCRNMTTQVYVIVENQGDYPETFNVTAYVQSTMIGEQSATVNPKQNTTVTFICNTTGFVEYGNYTFAAQVSMLPYETHLYDNTLTNSSVIVTHMGDIDGNKKVEVKDIAVISQAFGANRETNTSSPKYGQYWHPTACSKCPHPPNADIDDNGKIETKDVAFASKFFGWVG
ncbi:ABC transporter substrate-binding protein [Candidatus Bathyarchaeota archaeon]|nr:ABC transporter substrate-binding protein [Candidatus Bathyarchaeota archaeon]